MLVYCLPVSSDFVYVFVLLSIVVVHFVYIGVVGAHIMLHAWRFVARQGVVYISLQLSIRLVLYRSDVQHLFASTRLIV
jgi:hypothetical protein